MDENFIFNLINPLSRIKGRIAKEKSIINLPAINISEYDLKKWASDSDYCTFRATISAYPISNAKDCIVTVTHENYCQLAFIRIDKDTTWTYIRFEGAPFVIGDVVYVEDKFYYFRRMKWLYSFVVTSNQFTLQDVKLVAKYTADNHCEKEYLVELSDRKELWMVRRYTVWKRRRPGQEGILKTKKFKVYKIKLDADECKWTEIHTLGGFALFVGANSSIAVLASNFSRCLTNCIYFVNDWTGSNGYNFDDVGVYNIEEKRLLSIPRHTLNMMKMSGQESIWIEATMKL
ncbi:PREDICTED: probable F-box protein At1g65740 [Fragaria vesca subsp. vesca]|uniref:probable F-box protein At1g65740 n=1 Tax=Fragaria vesca subsp. vesca TaxID=101020 RepID=UPI0002C34B8F|nr:PREDICTED: probable F-box protein At1g65740 [Fragaria vesca subsp. vesca]